MSLNSISLLGISVTIDSKEEVLEYIRKRLENVKGRKSKIRIKDRKPVIIYTPNPEIINQAKNDEDLKQIVNSAQIDLPDGSGVVWAIRKVFGIPIDRVAGVDFVQSLCALALKKRIRIGLIGGRGKIALKTRECLRKMHPRLGIEVLTAPEIRIWNKELGIKNTINSIPDSKFLILYSSGYKSKENKKYFDRLVREIKQKKISILFVAFGFPKQEIFIKLLSDRVKQSKRYHPLVLMAVGGAFDYIAGQVPRAPDWMREYGLEWLYRLIREPRRLGRQIRGAQFFWDVYKI